MQTRIELALCGTGGAAGIDRVESKAPGALRISMAGTEADLSLETHQIFVTMNPTKPGGALEVRAPSRYAVLPDYFGYDVVYEPTRLKGEMLLVPAENFIMNFVEGNRAIVMCVWPGSLANSRGKGGADAGSGGREPLVHLILKGEGSARRIAVTRIELVGGPVHVAIFERDNLWHDQDVSEFKPLEPVKLDWTRPFDAHWRLNTLVAPGKKSPDLISRSQSYRFLYAPATKQRRPRPGPDADIEDRRAVADSESIWEKGYPVVYEERLYSHIYPAWFKGDETYIALYDNPKRPQNENVYDRILIYPIDRDKASPRQTPLEVRTFVDVMRETLGQEPCSYVLDLEGVRGRSRRLAGGDRKIMNDATCTIWRDIYSIMGGRTPKELPPEKKALVIQGIQDMGVFLHAVADRIEEYRQFNERLLKFIVESKGRAGPVGESVGAIAQAMKAMMEQYEKKGKHKETLAYWDKTIPELIANLEADRFEGWEKAGKMRHLGQSQDNQVSDCRRYVKAIRQEVAFVEGSDPEAQKFVIGVRAMCGDIMRNPHPKELLQSDPNSPRIGLTLDQR